MLTCVVAKVLVDHHHHTQRSLSSRPTLTLIAVNEHTKQNVVAENNVLTRLCLVMVIKSKGVCVHKDQ